jgi:hypothetical protein
VSGRVQNKKEDCQYCKTDKQSNIYYSLHSLKIHPTHYSGKYTKH